MTNDVLNPLQKAFLQAFFATSVGQRFFLTGGSALAAFHLQHRFSDDLDIFTLDDQALEASVRPVETIALELNCELERTRVSQYFVLPYMLKPLELETLQIFYNDLARKIMGRLSPER